MKKRFLIFFVFILAIQATNPLPPPPPGFDEFMENVDMDQLLKDMESIFGPMDEPPAKQIPRKQSQKNGKKSPLTLSKVEGKKKPEDKETTFKKPFEVQKGESTQVVKKLPSEKREAFLFFMDDFIKKLENLEIKIDSFEFGMPFKEELEDLKLGDRKETYKNLVSNTKIQYGLIKSKQLYQRGFYLESNNELRENIIKALKKIKNIKKPKDIKQFFSITLPSISEKLTKATDTESMKKEIEGKIKKREKLIQDAKRKLDRAARTAKRRGRPGSRRGRGSGPSWRPGGRDDFFHPWRGRARQRGFAPYREPSRFQKPRTSLSDKHKTPSSTDSKDNQKGFTSGKATKEINKIINTKKQIGEKLKDNIASNKELKDILTKKEILSEIQQDFKSINEYQTNLSEKELVNLEKIDRYKKVNDFFTEQLKSSLPSIIKLCKFDKIGITGEEESNLKKEQKSALNIFQQIKKESVEFKKTAEQELEKQEKEIWAKINVLGEKTPALTADDKTSFTKLTTEFENEPRGKLFEKMKSELEAYKKKHA